METYRFSAFGEEWIFDDEGNLAEARNPWRYSSKRVDPETGFIYFGRRYYDPATAKWVTQDPLGDEDGPNLYAYVHNNPLGCIDAEGLFSFSSLFQDRWAAVVTTVVAAVEVATIVGMGVAGLAEGLLGGYMDSTILVPTSFAAAAALIYNDV